MWCLLHCIASIITVLMAKSLIHKHIAVSIIEIIGCASARCVLRLREGVPGTPYGLVASGPSPFRCAARNIGLVGNIEYRRAYAGSSAPEVRDYSSAGNNSHTDIAGARGEAFWRIAKSCQAQSENMLMDQVVRMKVAAYGVRHIGQWC
jgi:hypothetical protein